MSEPGNGKSAGVGAATTTAAPQPGARPTARKVIHVDMDAFYAAVEQHDDPRLRDRAVAVGGSGRRGVILTASYEARTFGVRSAMPTARALALCPQLEIVRPRFDAYKAASQKIRAVFARWTTLIEPLSLDEAFLDVTSTLLPATSATTIARAIKAGILAETGLHASAGVSYNKFLAKLASDHEKPDGLTVIRPGQAQAFLAALPIERFHGVGPATAARLRAAGITTGADLQGTSAVDLARRIGSLAPWLRALALGSDDRPVRPDRHRRSLGVERTFDQDLLGEAALMAALAPLAAELARRQAASAFFGRSLVLKLKTAEFVLTSRRRTPAVPPQGEAAILELARQLLATPALPMLPLRLLGLTLANAALPEDDEQLRLFD